MLVVERDPRVTRCLAKLDEARRLGLACFGVEAHRFALAPPVSAAEVAAFEAQHGVELPAAYRTFVLDGGAHGAGPFHGILPLSAWADARVTDAARVGDHCALQRGMSRDEFGALDEPLLGTITVAHEGCSYYTVLVVVGPDAGAIAYVDVDGARAPQFCDDADFLAWYERWLDELRGGFDVTWFGHGLAGTEASFAAHLADPTSARHVDALDGLWRVPTLSPASRALVAGVAGHADPAVRTAAWRVIVRHRLHDVEPRWDDPVPEVRRLALDAAIACELPWHDAARRALDDPDLDVARRALRAFDRAPPIEQVLAMLDGPIASDAVAALAKQPSERAVPALLDAARRDRTHTWAVIAHVRAGVATPAQIGEALELLVTAPRPVPALFAAIVNTGVPPHAQRALGSLLACARHDDAFVRYETAGALGDVPLDESVTALVALADDTTMPREGNRSTMWSVGTYAQRSLAKLRGSLGRA